MSLKISRLLKVASAAFFIACTVLPAAAQWQVPNHGVPVGRGTGATGFNSVGPCGAGVPILGTGLSTDPACNAIDLAGSGITGNLAPSHLNGGSGANSTTCWRGDGVWAPCGGGGSLLITVTPQHRITLATGTPVMTSSQAAKTTVFVTPYTGNIIPIYDGSNFSPLVFAETSQATTDATKSPAAVAPNSVYDIFCWIDSGTGRCTRGPPWTNSTTRSAGTALVSVNGILLNNASITNGPASQRGTYVGSICSDGSSQINYIFGASSSGGTAANFCVWNAYNRVSTGTTVIDSGGQYSDTTSTVRQARASSGNQINFLLGLSEDAVFASYTGSCQPSVSSVGRCQFGLGFDSITALSRPSFSGRNNSNVNGINFGGAVAAQNLFGIGQHYIAALESNPNNDPPNAFFDLNANNALEAIIRN